MNNKHISKFKLCKKYIKRTIIKITDEYKSLIEVTRKSKAFKIIEIKHLSIIPGESKFLIQVTNKNCILELKTSEILNTYSVSKFNEFDAKMLKKAAEGQLIEFLDELDQSQALFKIVSKKFDYQIKKYIFTIRYKNLNQFYYTAEELAQRKEVLANMNFQDTYDIAFTQGMESVLKEKTAIWLAKQKLKAIGVENDKAL